MIPQEDYESIPITSENIQKLHILYLETMYHLNTNGIERFLLTQEGKYEEASKIKLKDQPIIERAKAISHRIKTIRLNLWRVYDASDKARAYFDAKAKEDMVWWINNFVWTYDPRLVALGMEAIFPLVCFPEQENLLRNVEECYRTRIPCLIEKSRAWGLTELICAFDAYQWKYSAGYKGTWGSRKESLVDELSQPDTIFARLRRIIYYLPLRMRPPTFEVEAGPNDNSMRIFNPQNQSIITGEAGENMGRGGRSSKYTIDEAPHIEDYQKVNLAVSNNTDFQLEIGTPNGPNDFFKKRNSGRVRVLTCWWYTDPAKNLDWRSGERPQKSDWYELECLKHDPIDIACNIDISYNASTEGAFIPAEWVQSAISFQLPASGISVAGLDLAAGGKNKTVYICRRGSFVCPPQVISSDSIFNSFWSAIDKATVDNVAALNYDMAGIGKSAFDLAKEYNKKFKFPVNGILGQSSAGDEYIDSEGRRLRDKFGNLRSVLWWNLRERFRKTFLHKKKEQLYPVEEMISIPSDNTLISQLSAVKMVYGKNGKIYAESKEDMKARGVDSPDEADALTYSFAPNFEVNSVLANFSYTTNSNNVMDFERSDTGECETYVSLIMNKDMSFSAICAQWKPFGKPILSVFDEFETPSNDVRLIVRSLRQQCGGMTGKIKEWIGNEALFPVKGSSNQTPFYQFWREKISIRRNYAHDDHGSIMLLNRWFDDGTIRISNKCQSLILQLASWKKKSGEPMEGANLCEALLQVVTRLKTKYKPVQKMMDKEYGQSFIVGRDGERIKI